MSDCAVCYPSLSDLLHMPHEKPTHIKSCAADCVVIMLVMVVLGSWMVGALSVAKVYAGRNDGAKRHLRLTILPRRLELYN